MRLVTPYPLPVMIIKPPACRVTSAINGLPTTIVATRSGKRATLAWSRKTVTTSAAAVGHAVRAARNNAAADHGACMAQDGRRHQQRSNSTVIGTLRTIL